MEIKCAMFLSSQTTLNADCLLFASRLVSQLKAFSRLLLITYEEETTYATEEKLFSNSMNSLLGILTHAQRTVNTPTQTHILCAFLFIIIGLISGH